MDIEALLTNRMASEITDDELASLDRQPEGFSQLYERYAVRIFRYLSSRLSDRTEAEDLTAQVFLDAYQRLAEYKPRNQFASWLFTIASRRAADYYRRTRQNEKFDEDVNFTNYSDPLSKVMTSETIDELSDMIQKQSLDEREMLRLRFAAELSFAEIGRVTGRTPAAVKMALRRCLNRMKLSWEEKNE
ncbi:MAG: RNA polymerase sigma factor [Bellilinea sp.]